ncbi:MAG: hypothetical protein GC162_10415 [Planctomycetes bacterium]|nr:hypothetical protein [Planctomycetota bacterium]
MTFYAGQPASLELDTRHPLAFGLDGYFLPGRTLANLAKANISGSPTAATLGGSATKAVTTTGKMLTTGATMSLTMNAQTPIANLPGWTVAVQFLDMSNRTIWSAWNSGGFANMTLVPVDAGALKFNRRNDAGFDMTAATSTATVVGSRHTVVVAVRGTTGEIWIDGVLDTSFTYDPTAITTNVFAFGANVGGTIFRGDFIYCARWRVGLSQNMIRQLFADPFAMFRSRNRVIGFLTSEPPPAANLVRAAVVAGYPAAIGHVGEVAGDELINPAALMAGLREGWTLAESLAIATPKMNTNVRMIGDPIARVLMPRQGYNIYARPTDTAEDELIAVAPAGVNSIDLTDFAAGSTQLVSVRSVNRCGVEDDDAAPVRQVSFDDDGNLILPAPNTVIELRLKVAAGGEVTAVWLYRENGQSVAPDRFNVYITTGDDAFDFGTVDAAVSYSPSRQFSQAIGTYAHGTRVRVAVESVSADGIAQVAKRIASIVVDASAPDQPTGLAVEVTRE